LFRNTLNVCSPLSLIDQIPHPQNWLNYSFVHSNLQDL
jgi:hypothetical protein